MPLAGKPLSFPHGLQNPLALQQKADAAQTAPARGEAIAIGAGSQIVPSGRAQTNCRQDNPDSYPWAAVTPARYPEPTQKPWAEPPSK